MPGIDPKILEELWKNPRHWKWGSIYFCKEDPRVIVPKRQKWMGWTINFARPAAFPTLIALIVFLAAPMTWLAIKGLVNAPIWFSVLGVDVLVICLACWYLASKKKY